MSVNTTNVIRHQIKRLAFCGRARYCPICHTSVRFFHPHGLTLRPDACCPVCASLERHRLAMTYLRRETNLFDGTPKRMLHFAPEISLERRFRRIRGIQYLSADLDDPRAMVRIDLTAIPFDEASFDIIYCSHVLEQVADETLALRELHRVLRPGGWALLLVPITAEHTFEDPSVTDPRDRLRLFGQSDHLRAYGPDFAERATAAGFRVRTVRAEAWLGETEAIRLGITNQYLFHCTRPAPAGSTAPAVPAPRHNPARRRAA